MFGFPPILDGNAGIKFTRDADSGFPKPGIREIFYSVRDGNWTDPNTWQTASGRVGLTPTANDNVYIRHTISLPLFNQTTVSANANANVVCISAGGTLAMNSAFATYLYVYDRLLVRGGRINTTSGWGSIIFLLTTGEYDEIKESDITGTRDVTFAYIRNGNQKILPFISPPGNSNNRSMILGGSGIKTATSDLNLAFNLQCDNVTLDLNLYNLSVTGSTSVNNTLITRSGGNSNRVVFVGNVHLSATVGIDFSSTNTDVEFRGGVRGGQLSPTPQLGSGSFYFTTNNQAINTLSGERITFNNKLIIDNVIVTATNVSSFGITLNDTINGTTPTSQFVMGSTAVVNFATAASVPSMTTGTWDFTTNANTIQYNGNYSATIPSYFTTFSSLTIGGTGTKTLGVNTTLNGNLTVNGLMECSIFNLTINGTTTFGTNSSFTKNGAGNLVFGGNVFGNNWDFKLTGNPNVEIRNGFNCQNTTTTRWDTGTGLWTFSTTNNQIFQPTNSTINMNCNVLISGAITVQFAPATGFPSRIDMYGSIDGNNAASTLDNRLTLYFYDITKYLPMSTLGTFIFNVTSTSIIGYMFNGSITLPTTSYMGLVIAGTGTKTLLGNTTILANLRVEGTLQLSTFDLTVNGTTFVPNPGTLAKNSTGNVLFIGLLTLSGGGAGTSGNLNFSGNPNVELRNGLNNTNSGTGFTSGNGTYTFSTNNQNLDIVNTTVTFNGNVIIGNNIIVTQVNAAGAGFTGTVIFTGTLNGSNASSTYRIGSNGGGTPLTTNYQNTTQPMATGVLDTSTNLNTFIYGAGNQDVRGGTPQQYRNLRFSGSGTTKTLLGNINVQNTYTVDAGVTVNLNGFIKTP